MCLAVLRTCLWTGSHGGLTAGKPPRPQLSGRLPPVLPFGDDAAALYVERSNRATPLFMIDVHRKAAHTILGIAVHSLRRGVPINPET